MCRRRSARSRRRRIRMRIRHGSGARPWRRGRARKKNKKLATGNWQLATGQLQIRHCQLPVASCQLPVSCSAFLFPLSIRWRPVRRHAKGATPVMTPPETATVSPDIAPPSRDGFWSLVAESLRGARHDFTSLPLGRAIMLLAVPMVLEMVMESVFALADVFWVSKLGPDAIATVMLTESMLIIIYAFAMGLAMGT